MKKVSRGVKWAVIISIIYTIIIIFLFVNRWLVSTEFATILLSLCSGLIGWLITQSFTSMLNRDSTTIMENIENQLTSYTSSKFPIHNNETTNILEILKRILNKHHLLLIKNILSMQLK